MVTELGLFETMLVANGRVVQLEEHHARMAASCVALGFPVPSPDAFRACLATTDEAVRCTYVPDRALQSTAFPIPAATRARREHGRALTLDPSWARTLPQHKTTDYDVCVRALRQAVEWGADEALFTTTEGNVLEGTATNVFAVRGTTLITAPSAVLPGIVRAWVLAQGLPIEERPPTVDEIREGAFFTGSLTTIAPLRTIDGLRCAEPGEVVAELMHAYMRRLSTPAGSAGAPPP